MTPLRSNRANNRANRSQIDHDIMEGLPVRQWRKQPTLITSTALSDSNAALTPNPKWRNMPMPLGSELYSPMSAALLRAARRGHVSRHNPSVEDDKDTDDDEAEAAVTVTVVAAPETDADPGFVAARWNVVPRDAELPEPDFLAPRRKGLPSLHVEAAKVEGTAVPMRKTKVRKIDGEGHSAVWDVLVPEGAVVEGEVLDGDEVLTEAVAPGTIVKGVGVANADGIVIASEPLASALQRKKYHPPKLKRKGRGPGRGRKKFQRVISGTMVPGTVPTAGGPMTSQTATTLATSLKPHDASIPGTVLGYASTQDGSVVAEGEEASDDDDDDDDDDADREDGELSPTPEPETQAAVAVTDVEMIDEPTIDVPPRDLSSSPDLPLAATGQAPVIKLMSAAEATSAPLLEEVPAVDEHDMTGIEQQDSIVEVPLIIAPVERTVDSPLKATSPPKSISEVVEPAAELQSSEILHNEATLLPAQSASPSDLTLISAVSFEEGSALPMASAVENFPSAMAPATLQTTTTSPRESTSPLVSSTDIPPIPPEVSSDISAPSNTEAEKTTTSIFAPLAPSDTPDMPDVLDVTDPSAPVPTPKGDTLRVAEDGASAAVATIGEKDEQLRFVDGEENSLGNLERSLEASKEQEEK